MVNISPGMWCSVNINVKDFHGWLGDNPPMLENSLAPLAPVKVLQFGSAHVSSRGQGIMSE